MSDPLITVPDSVWKPTVKRTQVLAQLAETQRCSKRQINVAQHSSLSVDNCSEHIGKSSRARSLLKGRRRYRFRWDDLLVCLKDNQIAELEKRLIGDIHDKYLSAAFYS